MLLRIIGLVMVAGVLGRAPEVSVKEGRLRGKYRMTKTNRTFSAFEGIPYAVPPLGQLRFKPPIPAELWEGVREATTVHNVCPQRDIYRRTNLIEGDEDCLYLNVYAPQRDQKHSPPTPPPPVMVFFHGGGWLCGGGNSKWYGPDMLLDKDVVLVVPNYRLGALGFLSTGDEVAPGNNGLKDQNLALKWVRENIVSFGGDPEKITIFGESAGGASANLHMMSPLSRGLFQRAISQSGTAYCSWAVAPEGQAVKQALKLSQEFGCPTKSSSEMVDCLRNVPANDIIAKDKIFMKWDTDPMIPFKPVVEPDLEGAFLAEHPIDAVKARRFSQVPWMMGLNRNDGALRAAGILANLHLQQELREGFDHLVPISLLYDEVSPQVQDMTSKIKEFYFKDKKLDESTKDEITNMYTDGWFLHGADEAARHHLKYGSQPIYYYLFEHRGASSFTQIFGDKVRDYGVCHADELQYLFPVGDDLFPDKPLVGDDEKMVDILTSLWVNFATSGNPTPDADTKFSNKWQPLKDENMDYYSITADGPVMKTHLLKDRTEFWRGLPTRPQSHTIKDEL